MEGMSLRIYYSYPGICEKLDTKIIKFFEEQGFDFYASGYNLEENKRDLAFDYKEKK